MGDEKKNVPKKPNMKASPQEIKEMLEKRRAAMRNRRSKKEPKRKDSFQSPLQASMSEFVILEILEQRKGLWMVIGKMGFSIPDAVVEDGTVTISRGGSCRVSVEVTAAEIASVAGIEESDVRSTLTIEQAENHIMDIATSKLCAKMGIAVS